MVSLLLSLGFLHLVSLTLQLMQPVLFNLVKKQPEILLSVKALHSYLNDV